MPPRPTPPTTVANLVPGRRDHELATLVALLRSGRKRRKRRADLAAAVVRAQDWARSSVETGEHALRVVEVSAVAEIVSFW